MTTDTVPGRASPAHSGKFLVCVSGSDESKVALRFACVKAKKRGGMVDILHVIPPADFSSLFGLADKMREERRQEAENLMQRLANEAYNLTALTPSILLREGDLGEEILAAANEDYDATMLVLGVTPQSHNRGKLIAWLSQQLGDRLLIPMLLVPGNLTEQQMEELS